MNTPKYLYRQSDGERFTKNEDGTYSMDSSMMGTPYTYNYETLMSFKIFSSEPPTTIENIEPYHGL